MKIGYVEHPHHQKTESTKFFRDQIVDLGHELFRIRRDDFTSDIAAKYECLILFQADECISIAAQSGMKTLVIPMLDESLMRPSSFFRTTQAIEYISFSINLHNFLTLSGVKSYHVQFWPEPNFTSANPASNVLFWERTPVHVSVRNVQHWFRNLEVELTIRRHLDPGQKAIDPGFSQKNTKTRFIEGDWISHEKYLTILEASTIFVAPRRWEGLGLSSLEAISRGIPVVGLDSPTLNEYIENGVSGILVQNKYAPLEDCDFEALSQNLKCIVPEKHSLYRKQINNALSEFFGKSKLSNNQTALIPGSLTLRQYLYALNKSGD